MTNESEWTDWIKHDGDKCPVPWDEDVIVKLHDYEVLTGPAHSFLWHQEGYRDIAHYKRLKSNVPAEKPELSAISEQVGGDHYKKLGAYQPVEVLKRWLTPEEFRGYMKGTAIVYLARERDKGGDEDITKSGHTVRLWEELK
jgi:hypothetical protein